MSAKTRKKKDDAESFWDSLDEVDVPSSLLATPKVVPSPKLLRAQKPGRVEARVAARLVGNLPLVSLQRTAKVTQLLAALREADSADQQ